MPEVKERFIVEDESDDYLWLRKDEDNRSGLEVPVPKKSPEYDSDVEKKLTGLNTQTKFQAVLVNENEDNTAWRVRDIL